MDLDKLKTAADMIRSARVNAKRVALNSAVGTLSKALNLVKEVMTEHQVSGEDQFFYDIEQMAHGFICATLSNPAMLDPNQEIDTKRLIHDSVQTALDLRGHIIEVRKAMKSDKPV